MIGVNAGAEGPTLVSDVVRSNGLYFVSATYTPGKVSVFDSKGDYLHSIGARGRGPGENLAATRLAAKGDTVFVYDEQLRRIQAFHVDGQPTGFAINLRDETPFASAASTGLILVRKREQEGSGEIQHVQGDSVIRSFQFVNASTKAARTEATRIVDTGESVWIAHMLWYEFENYTYDGRRLDRIAATKPHFAGGLSPEGWANLDSLALIADMEVDARGRLLVSHIVRDRTTPSARPREGGERGTSETWKAVIEVFQPASRRLVARYVEHDSRLLGFADPNHIYAVKESEDGTPTIEVFRISVVQPNSQEVCQ